VLLNYHIGRFFLGSLCVGDLVRLGLSSVRVVGCNLQHGHYSNPTTQNRQLLYVYNKSLYFRYNNHTFFFAVVDFVINTCALLHRFYIVIVHQTSLGFISTSLLSVSYLYLPFSSRILFCSFALSSKFSAHSLAS